MRLINVKAFIESQIVKLDEFFGDDIPPYAILSHTWGKEEVTFQDLQHPSHKEKSGYTKIERMCYLASQQQIEWVWIDTCCIDKSSSAELSEGTSAPEEQRDLREAYKTEINSMFKWYERASVCFIHLEDVPSSIPKADMEKTFRKAKWLTRGWTLQEFIAPDRLKLLNSDWGVMTKADFKLIDIPIPEISWVEGALETTVLEHFTGIEKNTWWHSEVPRILSWAAGRQTTRQEDMAYCLLGLLGVNMPLLYGEGNNAFTRLLEEVIKNSNSHSVLAAWYELPYHLSSDPMESANSYLLPRSPWPYRKCTDLIGSLAPGKSNSLHFSLTNAGLSIELPLVVIAVKPKFVLGILNCKDTSIKGSQVAIVLAQRPEDTYGQSYYRALPPLSVPIDVCQGANRENIYITNTPWFPATYIYRIGIGNLRDFSYDFAGIYPPCNVKRELVFPQEVVMESPNRITGPFVLLLTIPDEWPNIVIFVPQHPADSLPRPLVCFTNSTSVIEFLLAKNGYQTYESHHSHLSGRRTLSSTWSDSIDFHEIENLSCWSESIMIPVRNREDYERGPIVLSAKFAYPRGHSRAWRLDLVY